MPTNCALNILQNSHRKCSMANIQNRISAVNVLLSINLIYTLCLALISHQIAQEPVGKSTSFPWSTQSYIKSSITKQQTQFREEKMANKIRLNLFIIITLQYKNKDGMQTCISHPFIFEWQ